MVYHPGRRKDAPVRSFLGRTALMAFFEGRVLDKFVAFHAKCIIKAPLPALTPALPDAIRRTMLFPLIRPALFALEPERAHTLTLKLLALGARGAASVFGGRSPASLHTSVAGLDFANPVGLAAGVDKDGRAIDGFFGLGFGSVEIDRKSVV